MSNASKADALPAYVAADHAAADDPDLCRRSHAGLATIVGDRGERAAGRFERVAFGLVLLDEEPLDAEARGSRGGRAGSPTAPSPTGTKRGSVPGSEVLDVHERRARRDPLHEADRARPRRTRPSRGRARRKSSSSSSCEQPVEHRATVRRAGEARRRGCGSRGGAPPPSRARRRRRSASTTRVGLGDRGRRRDPREHEPVASELAELVGQPVEARLDRLEPRMTARRRRGPRSSSSARTRTSVAPEEVVRLDSLVPHLGDGAQRPLEVARARVAHRVEREPEPGAHPAVPSRRT